jgi:hypothetical protein
MLGHVRLLTLTGVGGVGKTRLALQLAAELSPGYPDGSWLVELVAVADPSATGHALAGTLGIAQQPGMTIEQSVVTTLSRRGLLLVLDNCEHLNSALSQGGRLALPNRGVKPQRNLLRPPAPLRPQLARPFPVSPLAALRPALRETSGFE